MPRSIPIFSVPGCHCSNSSSTKKETKYILILLLNRIEGFRTQESETLPGAIAETRETLAIGLTCANSNVNYFKLLIIIAASLLISYGIVFASTITNYQQRRQQQGLFQTPQSETVIS